MYMDAKEKKVLTEIINDESIRGPLELYFFQNGLPLELFGFRYFTDCVIVHATGRVGKFGDIYTMVGELRGEKSKTVAKPIENILNRHDYVKRALAKIAGTPYKPRLIAIEMVPATAERMIKLGIIPADLPDRCKLEIDGQQ